MAAIQESARIAAVEASADGISWTFSPMVDISRDPRWGRVSEGSGEDPFLGGAIAKAMVYGYQGTNLSDQLKRNDEILACVKHFALYGAGEAGRDYNTVDMSRNRMFNEYMYPYEAAVEAGVGSVMASFNEIDGVPATANKWLMTDVLRKQWGFNGFVVTDFTGISEMMSGKVNVTYAKGSNLIGDAAYEERATMFGRSLNRDNRTDKELLDEALKTAAGADVIIAALGESSEMSGESSSRTNLDLPDVQRSLLEALLKTGKPVVLTLFTGRPLTLTWEQANVPAILNVWFGGSEAAYAIGDVLFGDVNPSGKLTMTFPKNVGQIPLFYNHKNTGRPLQAGKWFEKFRSNYLDVDNEPLYPFGYGLSYTTFRYSDIALSTPSMGQDGSITAAVTVTNTGKRDGAEVVQLYIRDLVGSITRPVRELKGFEKIFLRAGESKTVSFKITPELLRFYDYDLNHVAEPGDFDLFIGGSSQAARTARITLK